MSIKTIDKAAAELVRLYKILDRKAIDLTDAYKNKRLEGKEGAAWRRFSQRGPFSRPRPILDTIMRHEGSILLKPGYNDYGHLLFAYELAKVPAPSLGSRVSAKDMATMVHRSKIGFDPGEKYLVIDNQVLKAGCDYTDSVPSPHRSGGFDWSAPRSYLNDTYTALAGVDADLLKVIEQLRKYV